MSEKTQIKIESDDIIDDQPVEAAAAADQTAAVDELSDEDGSNAVQGLDDLAVKLETAEKEAQQHYDRLLRVSAEFDNYKKRTIREMQDTIKFANEKLIKELLSVVDNLERAIASVDEKTHAEDPLLKGVHLTLAEVLKILERHHVAPVAAMGQPFDPAFHQAMMQETVNDHPPNTVVRELQKGYLLHDRLLRPALVAVSTSNGKETDNCHDN
jgi:molecular chaperone GrpE